MQMIRMYFPRPSHLFHVMSDLVKPGSWLKCLLHFQFSLITSLIHCLGKTYLGWPFGCLVSGLFHFTLSMKKLTLRETLLTAEPSHLSHYYFYILKDNWSWKCWLYGALSLVLTFLYIFKDLTLRVTLRTRGLMQNNFFKEKLALKGIVSGLAVSFPVSRRYCPWVLPYEPSHWFYNYFNIYIQGNTNLGTYRIINFAF